MLPQDDATPEHPHPGDAAKPALMLAADISPAGRAKLAAIATVHPAFTPEARAEIAGQHGDRIRAVVTNGTTGLDASTIAALLNLGVICAQGAGYEGIDLAAASARGIAVTHGPGTNADCVADHTMALMLAALRDIPGGDAHVRAGRWRDGRAMRPAATGRRLGLLGLGEIGRRIARRAAAFDMTVAYHARSPRPDSSLTYYPTVLALAEWADILVVATPGGAATHQLVDAAILAALGPHGFLINIGRGSVVHTDALVAALTAGTLAGAALDVIDGEPAIPPALLAAPNLVLSPHTAVRSPESVENTAALLVANLTAFFAGQPVLTPVP